jgi:hypothetical protein
MPWSDFVVEWAEILIPTGQEQIFVLSRALQTLGSNCKETEGVALPTILLDISRSLQSTLSILTFKKMVKQTQKQARF